MPKQLSLIDSRLWLNDVSPSDQAYWRSRPDGEGWGVPCPNDTGRKHFESEHCRNCLCAGGSDATPYCMGREYDRAKKAAAKYMKRGNFREFRRYARHHREPCEEKEDDIFSDFVLEG